MQLAEDFNAADGVAPKAIRVGLYLAALFSFLSISAAYLGHALLICGAIGFYLQCSKETANSSFLIPRSTVALLVFWIFTLLSIVVNAQGYPHPLNVAVKSHYFFTALFLVFPFSYFLRSLKNPTTFFKKLSLIMVFSLAFSSAYGIAVWASGWEFFRRRAVASDTRVAGAFSVSSSYANVAALGVILGIWLLFVAYKKFSLTKFQRWIIGVSTLCSFVGLYLSYTRSALLAVLAAMPILFGNVSQKLKYFFIALFLFIVFCAVGIGVDGGVGNRYFQNIHSGSNSERLTQFQLALLMQKEHPLFGVGFRNFDKFDPQFKQKYALPNKQFKGNAHNNFLEVLATIGIGGFLAYIAWMLFWLMEIAAFPSPIRELSIALWVVFQVAGMFHSNIIDAETLVLLSIIYPISASYTLHLTMSRISSKASAH